MPFRFGNLIFDNLWNRDFIDNIQITFAERLGVEERGGYYDHSGALRDMVQNHTLQLLSLLAMDKPATFSKDAIRAEKIKVFEQLHNPTDDELKKFLYPWSIPFRYDRREKKISLIAVSPMSTLNLLQKPMLLVRSLLIAIASVEFLSFFRTGKRLTQKGTMVNVVFKQTDSIFGHSLQPNVLTIYIQPNEGFSLSINGKEVGEKFSIAPISFDYETDATATGASPEPYEKLIFDV